MGFLLFQERQAMAGATRRFAPQVRRPGYRLRRSTGCIERNVAQKMGEPRFLDAELPQARAGLGANRDTG